MYLGFTAGAAPPLGRCALGRHKSQRGPLPACPPAYLSQKLAQPLPTKDGGTLRTMREVCDYMTAMDRDRELRQHWQRAAKLILSKADVLTVSRALELHESSVEAEAAEEARSAGHRCAIAIV